jgi:hypothetical protein
MKEKTADLADMDAAVAEGAEAAGSAEEVSVPVRCTKQLAQIVGRSAKCLSSRQTAGLFIAGTATKSTRSSRFGF